MLPLWKLAGWIAGLFVVVAPWRALSVSGPLVDAHRAGEAKVAYAYYASGRVKTVADSSGRTRSFTWQAGGKQLSERRGDGTYAYDSGGNLSTLSRGGSTSTYATTSDRLQTETSAAGTLTYGYDSLGRLADLTGPRGTTTIAWEPGGARPTRFQARGLHESLCYDGVGSTKALIYGAQEIGCDSSAVGIARHDYTHDAAGNPLTETYSTGGFSETTTYGYDAAHRLSSVLPASGDTIAYQLHGDGSRSTETRVQGGATQVLTYSYDVFGGISRIDDGTGTALAQFTTDRAGRVKSDTRANVTRTYAWAGERLQSVTATDGINVASAAYTYDHAGRRTSRSSGASSTGYLWAGGDLVAEQPQPGQAVHYERAAGVLTAAGDERLLHDARGSITGSFAGSTTLLRQYDAWGSLRTGTLPTGPGYAGQHHDAATGLSYAQQRWYDPATGRFLSEDPYPGDLQQPLTLQPNLYANANPLRFVDPEGESGVVRGAMVGHVWGVAQVIGGGINDLQNNRIRSFGDYASLWGQNVIGGAQIGLSFDMVTRGGPYGLIGANALGNAGFGALTFGGEAQTWSDFGEAQLVDGATGAVLGPLVSKAGKVIGPVVQRIPGAQALMARLAAFGERTVGKLVADRYVRTGADDLVTMLDDRAIELRRLVDGRFPRLNPLNYRWGVEGLGSFPGNIRPKFVEPAVGAVSGGGLAAGGTASTSSMIARITPGSLPAAEEASLLRTLSHIDAGTSPTGALAKKWGTQFKNWGSDLPGARGTASPFLEYRVAPPPGTSGAGTLRVVSNPRTGEMFYTWTHYGDTGAPAFVQIR